MPLRPPAPVPERPLHGGRKEERYSRTLGIIDSIAVSATWSEGRALGRDRDFPLTSGLYACSRPISTNELAFGSTHRSGTRRQDASEACNQGMGWRFSDGAH